MTLTKFLVVMYVAGLPAMSQIQQPQLGYILDSGSALRPVLGIASSAMLGDPALVGAVSFACSSTLCLAKTDAAVVAFVPGASGYGQNAAVGSPIPTPCDCTGPALIALDPVALADGAWIYYGGARQMARWRNGVQNSIDFAPGGELLSLRATTDGFDYAIARETFGGAALARGAVRETLPRATDVVWIEHYSASNGGVVVLDSIALGSLTLDSREAIGAVMLLDDGILFSSADHVTLRRANGQELEFPVAGASALQAAGKGYVEIVAPGGMWMLRTDPGSEQLSLLPGTQPVATATPQGAAQ